MAGDSEDPDEPLLIDPAAPVAPAELPVKKPTLKERLKTTFKDYPQVAVFTYLGLSAVAIAAFSIAIGIGAEPSTATGVLGVIGAGWLAAKVTVPLRILATLALTPPIAAVHHRFKRKKPVVVDDAD